MRGWRTTPSLKAKQSREYCDWSETGEMGVCVCVRVLGGTPLLFVSKDTSRFLGSPKQTDAPKPGHTQFFGGPPNKLVAFLLASLYPPPPKKGAASKHDRLFWSYYIQLLEFPTDARLPSWVEGVDSFSIRFSHRSFQQPIALFPGVLGGFLERRIPGKNGEGTPENVVFHLLMCYFPLLVLKVIYRESISLREKMLLFSPRGRRSKCFLWLGLSCKVPKTE